MNLSEWHTKEKPNETQNGDMIIYVLKNENVMSTTLETLPGFIADNGRITDWERKNNMPLFQKFDFGGGMKNFEIIAWQEFPELSEEFKKLIWHRPFYIKIRV
jgi:hypothetical protein